MYRCRNTPIDPKAITVLNLINDILGDDGAERYYDLMHVYIGWDISPRLGHLFTDESPQPDTWGKIVLTPRGEELVYQAPNGVVYIQQRAIGIIKNLMSKPK